LMLLYFTNDAISQGYILSEFANRIMP